MHYSVINVKVKDLVTIFDSIYWKGFNEALPEIYQQYDKSFIKIIDEAFNDAHLGGVSAILKTMQTTTVTVPLAQAIITSSHSIVYYDVWKRDIDLKYHCYLSFDTARTYWTMNIYFNDREVWNIGDGCRYIRRRDSKENVPSIVFAFMDMGYKVEVDYK